MRARSSRGVCLLAFALVTAALGAATSSPAKPTAAQDDGWRTVSPFPVTSNISCVGLNPIQITCFSVSTDGQMQQVNWTEGATGDVRTWPKDQVATSAPDCLKIGQEIHCFFADRKGALVHATAGAHRNPVFETLGGAATQGPPACVSTAPGSFDCFVRDKDDAVHHIAYRSGKWSKWDTQPGKITSALSCITGGRHAIDCFARGKDNELRQNYPNADGSWAGWEDRGGGLSLSPECVSWGAGRVDCFVRGDRDPQMYHIAADGAGWHVWEPQGGHLSSGLSCVARKPNRLDCFVVGPVPAIEGVQHKGWNDTGWTAWSNLLAKPNMTPECLSVAPDSTDCFIREGQRMMHKRFKALP